MRVPDLTVLVNEPTDRAAVSFGIHIRILPLKRKESNRRKVLRVSDWVCARE